MSRLLPWQWALARRNVVSSTMNLERDEGDHGFRRPSVPGVLVCLLACACSAIGAPSEEEIKEEFAAEVERSNDCTADSECVVAFANCPLGCFALVNAQHKARVEQKARELVEDYESGGQSCVYDCEPAPPLACVDGECAGAP